MSDGPNLWYIGVGLEIVSTMSGTIGKQLIRLSELTKGKSAHLAKMIMIAGLVINTAVGPIVDMGAYSFASQSLIAPFGGLDVVWNALLAPFLLDEKLTWRRIVGCVLIMIGTGMAGCFGNHEDAEYTLEYLEETLLHVRVLIYFLVFFAWFLLNRFCLMNFPVGNAIRGVSLGCTAGTIAGNMFCVKAAIELIQRSINMQEGEIWLHWLPYVMLVGAVFFALTNVIYMTKGLQEFEALFMVTIYEGSMIVSGCVSGAVVLLDLRGVEAWRIGLYSLSVLIIVSGMYVIFSNEAMSKSSLMSGAASIEAPSRPLSPTRAAASKAKPLELLVDVKKGIEAEVSSLQGRSIHASCNVDFGTGDDNTPLSSPRKGSKRSATSPKGGASPALPPAPCPSLAASPEACKLPPATDDAAKVGVATVAGSMVPWSASLPTDEEAAPLSPAPVSPYKTRL
mmetsp:Transcript_56996/g.128909  ORF Transcript_56996/g.128909 Transcript_56996/m.128909 type:complete len:452 (-) Transcript_56996:121-1476(-)